RFLARDRSEGQVVANRDRSRRGVPGLRLATGLAPSRPQVGWWGKFFGLPSETMKARKRAPSLECLESRQLLTTITEYPLPSSGSTPVAITSGPGGGLWFLEQGTNLVGTVDPKSHAMIERGIPTAAAYPRALAVASDGEVWFTEERVSQIGVLDPKT